jgi:SET domain-containing protein
MSLLIRASKIHSAGCYTTVPIRKGTAIVEYTGPRITVEEADARYSARPETYLFGLSDGKHVIDGDGIAAFVNHCCDPNCEPEEVDGRIWIVALRDIAAGEELTYDYNLYDGEGDAPCFCGAKNCRGSLYSAEELRQTHKASRRRKSKPGQRRRKPSRS